MLYKVAAMVMKVGLLNYDLETEENIPLLPRLSSNDGTGPFFSESLEAEIEFRVESQTVEKICEAINELNDAQLAMESFKKSGIVDQQTPRAMSLYFKGFERQLGRTELMRLSSLESSDDAGLLQYVQDSLEVLSDTKNRLIEAVKHFVKTARKALQRFWENLWHNVPLLKKRYEILETHAKALSDQSMLENDSKTVKINARHLTINGRVPSDVPRALKETVDRASSVLHDIGKLTNRVTKTIAEGMVYGAENANYESRVQATPNVISVKEAVAKDLKEQEPPESRSSDYDSHKPWVYLTNVLLGEWRIWRGGWTDDDHTTGIGNDLGELSGFVSGIDVLSSIKNADVDKEAPVILPREASLLCQHAQKGLSCISDLRRDIEKKRKNISELEKTALKQLSKFETGKENDSYSRAVTDMIAKVAKGAMGAQEQGSKKLFLVLRALSVYIFQSLKAVEKHKRASV